MAWRGGGGAEGIIMPAVRMRLGNARWLVGAVAGALLASIGWAPASAAEDEERTVTAIFEGEEVPMDEVWDVATACAMWEDQSIECFRTKEEREDAERDRSSGTSDGLSTSGTGGAASVASSSSCPVRLYALTNYGGAELTLSTRLKWHNLNSYGFDNRTSSFKISGCSSTFRDGIGGSGSTYPGATSSWSWSSSMVHGWDNRVSSVWIH